MCSNYRGITLLSLPGKAYARVPEREIRPVVEPQLEEEQCGFHPRCGTLDRLFTLAGVLEGAWEFVYPVYLCFVYLKKAYDRVSRNCLYCRGVVREYGVLGSSRFMHALYYRLVPSECWTLPGLFPVTNPVFYIHEQDLKVEQGDGVCPDRGFKTDDTRGNFLSNVVGQRWAMLPSTGNQVRHRAHN